MERKLRTRSSRTHVERRPDRVAEQASSNDCANRNALHEWMAIGATPTFASMMLARGTTADDALRLFDAARIPGSLRGALIEDYVDKNLPLSKETLIADVSDGCVARDAHGRPASERIRHGDAQPVYRFDLFPKIGQRAQAIAFTPLTPDGAGFFPSSLVTATGAKVEIAFLTPPDRQRPCLGAAIALPETSAEDWVDRRLDTCAPTPNGRPPLDVARRIDHLEATSPWRMDDGATA